MRQTIYRYGLNMYRQAHRRRLARAVVAGACIVCAGLAGLSASWIGQRSGTPADDSLSRRNTKQSANGQARKIETSHPKYTYTWQLKVERVRRGIPSAAPSQPVQPPVQGQPTAAPQPAPATPPDTPARPQPVPVPETSSTPAPTTPVQDAPAPAPPVVETPHVVVVVPPPLPQIVLPVPLLADLDDPAKKDIAMQLVSSAENSSLDWKAQYGYIEDIGDGRGYTGGIIGFTSGTHDMLEMVRYYTKLNPTNPLAKYIPALQLVDGSDSHAGLGSGFVAAWKQAAADPLFRQAQNDERDRSYFNPAVSQAKADGLRALGQFIYYDAMVMHGPGNDPASFGGIRAAALKKAKTPAQGGDEKTYLHAFLDARVTAMKKEAAHEDVSRVETAQRVFLQAGNFNLDTPLSWKVYGDPFTIR